LQCCRLSLKEEKVKRLVSTGWKNLGDRLKTDWKSGSRAGWQLKGMKVMAGRLPVMGGGIQGRSASAAMQQK
jgi:hypothetical protein